jgi:hypothetical protein
MNTQTNTDGRTRIEISPRLMPGVHLGDVWVSITPDGDDQDGKPSWAWHIDGPGWGQSGGALSGWHNSQGMLADLLAFLAYHADGADPDDDAGTFSTEVLDWAQAHLDDIWTAESDLTEAERASK